MTGDGRAAAEFDAYSDRYDQSVNRALYFSGLKVDFFTRVKTDRLLEILDHHGTRVDALRMLDVGCGVGNYHGVLAAKVGSLVGVDVSSASMAVARERFPSVAYAAFDGAQLPFREASFEVVIMICVLHHVPPPHRSGLVREIRRVLRPGGLFAVFEHNPMNPLTRRVVSRCEFDRDAVLLSCRECEALIRGAEFTRVESRHILTVPPVTAPLRWLDRAMGAAPFGAQYYSLGWA
jgi:ubiquinone/menaquinone biosynthesis C-methylase UbiE